LDDAKARSELIETVVLIIDPPSSTSTSLGGGAPVCTYHVTADDDGTIRVRTRPA
jgi:hypothetical protein